jgi:hypothetical protein
MATTTNFGWETPDDVDLVKDGAAAMRTLGNSIDASFVDLKGGTSGQILSKASATDLDYTWITNDVGDITGITATTPLTGGGTSGAVTVGIQDALTTQKGAVQLSDSTSTTSSILAATPTAVKSAYDLANAAVAKSIVDAKGDLIAATAADTVSRLAIGANDTILTADSTAATGMKWAAPAAAGGWTLITSGSLTGTETTVSITTTGYKQVVMYTKDITCTSDWYWQLRLNGDSGSNYNSINSYQTSTSALSTVVINDAGLYTNSPFDLADQDFFGVWTIFDPANTSTKKFVTGYCGGKDNNNTYRNTSIVSGQYFGTTAAISSVTFLPASTFSTGTYEIYGVK